MIFIIIMYKITQWENKLNIKLWGNHFLKNIIDISKPKKKVRYPFVWIGKSTSIHNRNPLWQYIWKTIYGKRFICFYQESTPDVDSTASFYRDNYMFYQSKSKYYKTKPTKLLCTQRGLRSAWASAQSDQSLRCALNG